MAGQQILKRESGKRPGVGLVLVVGLLCLAAAGKAVLYDTLDPDCFWHLRVAEQLMTEGIHPLVDHLSFASRPEPWVPYSWLAELGMKRVWDFGGYRAAVAVAALMSAAFLAMIALGSWELVKERDGSDTAIVIATAFAAYISLPYLSFRPVTAALVILAACAWLMLRDRRHCETSKAVWLVPFIAALTINIHPFALMIPLWSGAVLAGAIWERIRGLASTMPGDAQLAASETRRRCRRYLALTILTAAACLCTPLLPGVIQTIAHYEMHDAMVAGPAIAETQPFFRGTAGFINVVLFLGIALLCRSNRTRIRAGQWLWLIGGGILLLQLGRFAPLFAIVAAPAIAAMLPAMTDNILARRPVQLVTASVILIGVIRIGFTFPGADVSMGTWINRNGADSPGYPAQAAHFVSQYIPADQGKIVNEFSWGGYLAWRLGPDFKVLCDGRTQCYSNEFWHNSTLGDAATRRRFAGTLTADAAIVPSGKSALREALVKCGWTSVYEDPRAQVLVPPLHDASAR